MKKTTLCFCVRNRQVLLAPKKKGYGSGNENGYGGKVKEGETDTSAVLRELKEESALTGQEKDLERVARIAFSFEGVPTLDCSVFILRTWTGVPSETEEMGEPTWYLIRDLPFHAMWPADARWLPLVLGGKKIQAEIDLTADQKNVISFTHTEAILE